MIRTKRNRAKVCPICGCDYETFCVGKVPTKLCPWCDEDTIVQISKEALRKNRIRIEKGLIKSGKTR